VAEKDIMRNAQRTLNEEMTLDADPDLTTSGHIWRLEYFHSFHVCLERPREGFLQKIDHGLEKLKRGHVRHLRAVRRAYLHEASEARLETTRCIRCKKTRNESRRRTAERPPAFVASCWEGCSGPLAFDWIERLDRREGGANPCGAARSSCRSTATGTR